IAVDYGGKWDITRAAQKIAEEVEAGKLTSASITPEVMASKLSFADLPDPDLFIRTSGELRISNFMLWQLAYSELYFCNSLWPDFGEKNWMQPSLIMQIVSAVLERVRKCLYVNTTFYYRHDSYPADTCRDI